MATPAAHAPRAVPRGGGPSQGHAQGRGRGRGGRASGRGPSASRQSRHAGRDDNTHEISALDRTARKFCHALEGCVRSEVVRGDDLSDHAALQEETVPGDHKWLVIALHEDRSPQLDLNETWRRMREKLEAVSVLSVLATTESYAWRRNVAFWQQFTRDQANHKTTEQRATQYATATPAPRADTVMPRFMLDFSFAEITADVIALLRHVLMGSEKSMRLSFKHTMESLATVPPRRARAASLPIALRFARCRFCGEGIVKKLVELVETVNQARARRQRELSNATSRVFYYQIVELDLSGVRLSAKDLQELRLLSAVVSPSAGFCVALDNTIDPSTDQVVPFGAVVSSWFKPEMPMEPEGEPRIRLVRGVGRVRVSLDSSALSPSHVASLFSAVYATGTSSATSHLSLRGSFQWCDSAIAWAWVAFGVWSRDSASSLVSLNLSGNVLRLEDTAIVHQVLSASDAAARATLVHRLTSGGAIVANAVPEATAKHKRRSRQHQRGSEPISLSSWICMDLSTKLQFVSPGKATRVALASKTVARVVEVRFARCAVVLVPGYGFVEVDLTTAMPVEDISTSVQRDCRLEELKLNSMVVPDHAQQPDTVIEALFSTLSLPMLTTLELNGNPLGQNALRAVLTACPALQSLSLEDCELESISAIIEAYDRGTCRLQALTLTENEISDRDITRLCRLVAQESSSASRLRMLNLHQNPLTTQSLRALSAAIRASPHALIHLVVDKEFDLDAQFRTVLHPFADQFIGLDELSHAHRHEFQAALARRLGATALEPSLLDNIYAFATSTRYRRIVWM